MSRCDWTAVRSALLIGLVVAGVAHRAAALNQPNQFCTGDPCVISSPKVADPNIVLDFGTRAVILQNSLTLQPLANGSVGSLTIRAGSFSVSASGQIRGFSSTANGGSVTIEVVNNIQINDTVGSGAVRLSGQDAGVLTLRTTTGSVTVSGRITIYGDGIPASGGTLNVDSATGATITGRIDMGGGLQGSGGDIDLSVAGDVLLTGVVDLSGGDVGGGFMDITAGGSVTLGEIDMSGAGLGGDAGFVTIDSGGNVRFQSTFRARGADNGEDCGDGADVDVTATGDITVAAEMDIRGRGLDCSGGTLALDGARVFLQGDVLMSGTGPMGSGGELDVLTTTLLRLNGTIELDGGDGGGGDILLISDGDMEIFGNLLAVGRTSLSAGASLADFQAGKLTISGTIDASAGSSSAEGTPISISACEVITNSSATIKALGSLGSISIEANDTLMLRGHFVAATNGGISLRYGPQAAPPDINGASFTPAPTQTQDPLLTPCRVCESNADCVDGDPCTDDICNVTACLNPVHNGIPCTDGDPCTIGDACMAGVCVSGPMGTCNDLDADGKVDDADECTTVMWLPDPTIPPNQNPNRFSLTLKRLSAEPGKQAILIKGLFNTAPSQPLVIDPSANGVHVYIEDAAGPLFDVSLPGGPGCGPDDGWETLGAGFRKTWKYSNESDATPTGCATGSARGVTSVRIKDKRLTNTGGLQFKIKAKSATLLRQPVPPLTRLQFSFGLGAQSFPGVATQQAKVGQCAEALFTGNPIPSGPPPSCRAKLKNGVIDSVLCKGKK